MRKLTKEKNKSPTEWLLTISSSRHREFKLFPAISVSAIHMALCPGAS